MQDKVILNEKSFKALSADSRVSILKNLTNRRMTLSELSKKLNLKNSTVKEHCEILSNAELIKKIDEGRKWKYYELTSQGREVISPSIMESARVMVMLSLSAILFAGIILTIFSTTIIGGLSSNALGINDYAVRSVSGDASISESLMAESELATDAVMTQKSIVNSSNIISLDYNLFSGIIIIVLLIGLIVGFVARKKF